MLLNYPFNITTFFYLPYPFVRYSMEDLRRLFLNPELLHNICCWDAFVDLVSLYMRTMNMRCYIVYRPTFQYMWTMNSAIPLFTDPPISCATKDTRSALTEESHRRAQGLYSPTLACLYLRCTFYRRLSGPQDQSGHEGVEKISTPILFQTRPSSS